MRAATGCFVSADSLVAAGLRAGLPRAEGQNTSRQSRHAPGLSALSFSLPCCGGIALLRFRLSRCPAELPAGFLSDKSDSHSHLQNETHPPPCGKRSPAPAWVDT